MLGSAKGITVQSGRDFQIFLLVTARLHVIKLISKWTVVRFLLLRSTGNKILRACDVIGDSDAESNELRTCPFTISWSMYPAAPRTSYIAESRGKKTISDNVFWAAGIHLIVWRRTQLRPALNHTKLMSRSVVVRCIDHASKRCGTG